MGHVPHLYVPDPWDGDILALTDGQRHHLQRVLRLGRDDPVFYTDGNGWVGSGLFAGDGVSRGEESRLPPPPMVTVAVTPPRSRDRLRFLVEKLAELGVTRLVWIRTSRSEGRPPAAEKARAWATAALEQSRGAWVMEIDESTVYDLAGPGLVVADPDGDPTFPAHASTLLVGPEGGLDPDEVPAEASPVSLGPTILRVETAAVVGAALLIASVRR